MSDDSTNPEQQNADGRDSYETPGTEGQPLGPEDVGRPRRRGPSNKALWVAGLGTATVVGVAAVAITNDSEPNGLQPGFGPNIVTEESPSYSYAPTTPVVPTDSGPTVLPSNPYPSTITPSTLPTPTEQPVPVTDGVVAEGVYVQPDNTGDTESLFNIGIKMTVTAEPDDPRKVTVTVEDETRVLWGDGSGRYRVEANPRTVGMRPRSLAIINEDTGEVVKNLLFPSSPGEMTSKQLARLSKALSFSLPVGTYTAAVDLGTNKGEIAPNPDLVSQPFSVEL